MTKSERETKALEIGKLQLLEREYWNVVDGGVEDAEVSHGRAGGAGSR